MEKGMTTRPRASLTAVIGSAGGVIPPDDLDVFVAGEDEIAVRVDSRSGEPEEIGSGTGRVIAAAFPPEEGTYVVSAESKEVSGRRNPSLTFGQSPVGAVEERFESIIDELKRPTGIVIAAGLLILFLIPRIKRAIRVRS